MTTVRQNFKDKQFLLQKNKVSKTFWVSLQYNLQNNEIVYDNHVHVSQISHKLVHYVASMKIVHKRGLT